MPINLTPKQDFQKNDDITKAYRAVVDNPGFREGLHLAITEFVLAYKPTTEELEGVRRFLDVMLNMAEKPEPHVIEPFMQSIAHKLKPQPNKS